MRTWMLLADVEEAASMMKLFRVSVAVTNTRSEVEIVALVVQSAYAVDEAATVADAILQ